MARNFLLLALTPFLADLVSGQTPGPTREVHPKLITQRCTKKGGCKKVTNYVVLDSLAHPVYQKNAPEYNCGDWGQKPNATACPDAKTCVQNCIMDGIKDYTEFGVTAKGGDLTLRQLLDGKLVTPRVYLLDQTEQKYEMLKLTGNEFTFEVDATTLPCGMNSALYLSEMEAKGGKGGLNKGGAYYGTGYCDAQCYTTPFINGKVSNSSIQTRRLT